MTNNNNKEVKYINPGNTRYDDWERLFLKHNFKFSTVEAYETLAEISAKDGEYKPTRIKDVKSFVKNNGALNKRSRTWVFTIHNPHLYYASFDELSEIFNNWKAVKDAIWSLEVGKSGKTLHIQGYLRSINSITKKGIINKLNNAEIWLDPARGGKTAQREYIEKQELHQSGKTFAKKGQWDIEILSRADFNIEEFIDYALENSIPVVSENMYKYCKTYRQNTNSATINKIFNTLAIRSKSHEPKGVTKPVIFTGKSGVGKSALTDYIIRQFNIHEDFILNKTAKDSGKKDWFSNADLNKKLAFYSEVNYTFPMKPSLLGLIDGKPLTIVGGTIPNNISMVILNTTNTTIGWIYNTTLTKGSFTEIYRRIINGSQYYIARNTELEGFSEEKLRSLSSLRGDDFVKRFPPRIYKFIDDSNVDSESVARDKYEDYINADYWSERETFDVFSKTSRTMAKRSYLKSDNLFEISEPDGNGTSILSETSEYDNSISKTHRVSEITLEQLILEVGTVVDGVTGLRNSTIKH